MYYPRGPRYVRIFILQKITKLHNLGWKNHKFRNMKIPRNSRRELRNICFMPSIPERRNFRHSSVICRRQWGTEDGRQRRTACHQLFDCSVVVHRTVAKFFTTKAKETSARSSRLAGPRVRVGFLRRGNFQPLPHQLGSLRECCKLPQLGPRCGAPVAKRFSRVVRVQSGLDSREFSVVFSL